MKFNKGGAGIGLIIIVALGLIASQFFQKPQPFATGVACNVHSDCVSVSGCEQGCYCYPYGGGWCYQLKPNGDYCSESAQCQSGSCVNSVCSGSGTTTTVKTTTTTTSSCVYGQTKCEGTKGYICTSAWTLWKDCSSENKDCVVTDDSSVIPGTDAVRCDYPLTTIPTTTTPSGQCTRKTWSGNDGPQYFMGDQNCCVQQEMCTPSDSKICQACGKGIIIYRCNECDKNIVDNCMSGVWYPATDCAETTCDPINAQCRWEDANPDWKDYPTEQWPTEQYIETLPESEWPSTPTTECFDKAETYCEEIHGFGWKCDSSDWKCKPEWWAKPLWFGLPTYVFIIAGLGIAYLLFFRKPQQPIYVVSK